MTTPAFAMTNNTPGLKYPFLAGLTIVFALAVTTAAHAVQRHGDDAIAVRNCVSNNPTINYRDLKDPSRFLLLCQLPDGRWGLQVVTKIRRTLQEVTAYIPKDGSWGEVSNFVLRNAIRFKGPLP